MSHPTGTDVAVRTVALTKSYRIEATTRIRRLAHVAGVVSRERAIAVEDVSLEIRRGESFGLMGANGSGKSTLLRCIAGVTRPTTGSVVIDGRVNGLLSLGESLHPELSGEHNAYTTALLSGLRPAEARRKLDWIASFAELAHVLDRPLRTYSEGMKLRLAFAASVAMDPDILLIDELAAVGDSRFQERCMNHLEELHASGVTVVLTSHSLEELRRLCTRAVWLREGRVVEMGPIEQVAERYTGFMMESLPPAEVDEHGGTRTGTGEARIGGFGVVGLDGRHEISSGEALAITIEIETASAPRAIVSIGVSTDDGRPLIAVNLDEEGRGLAIRAGQVVAVELARADLGPGRYHLDVGLWEPSWSHPYDYRFHQCQFDVTGPGERDTISPPHSWRILSRPAGSDQDLRRD